jgi:hypothetical protein
VKDQCMNIARLSVALLAAHAVLATACADTFVEDFSSDPSGRGWSAFGDSGLCRWDSTNQNLLVTWDSSGTNSYFHRPLGTVLTTNDDFALAFDLRVDDAGPGPNGDFSFELAIGFLNIRQAVQTNFLRGYAGFSGQNFAASNLVEFAYFWDSGFGATVWPSIVDTNNYLYTANWSYNTNVYIIHQINLREWYHVAMTYTASERLLVTTLTNASGTDGAIVITPLGLDSTFSDFRVDTVSINNYSDNDGFGGSVLAHGVVDNLVVTIPAPPIQDIVAGFSDKAWEVQFTARTNWVYTLQRSGDFRTWTNVSVPAPANATNVVLQDTNAPAANSFYRVLAER